jgi:predicted nuclease of restriction endonuclease-like (RecB) superfamily
MTDELQIVFLQVSFTHHNLILSKVKTIEERIFYIQKIAQNFWSVDTLKHHIKSNLYQKEGLLPNNFTQTLTDNDLRAKALQSFKDEYFLDFINIEDPDEADERLIENEIVRNIKKFLLSLGADFAFLGNQFRIIVDEDEYFIDLLFFNRKLQCLVAFELKKGKFKPEYLGKLNFYLSALDEYVKQPHEKPSIGIILCKEKNNKTVEFSFRDFNKSMGVATYKTAHELPEEFKNSLPDVETLKKLMD